MKFIVVRKGEAGINFPIMDKDGCLSIFDNREEADLERIYHQPDYEETLVVFSTKLGDNK